MSASQEIADRLEAEGEKNLAFLREVPDAIWDQQIYADGAGWSVRDLLTHIVEVEQSIPRLVQRVVESGRGVAEDFDLNAYNEKKVNESGERNVARLLDTFAERRAQTVAMVAAFSEADLQREGRHPFLGETQVIEMLKLMYLHVQLHIRDIRRLIKSTQPS